MQANEDDRPREGTTLLDRVLRFCLDTKLVVILLLGFLVVWGLNVAPFDWRVPLLPRDPVPVDAIPDIGENQQIIFTEWMGRSPQDVEDQVTYPLTVALLGVPEVQTIRSYSSFGFSMIFVIFREGAEFYWTRSRILEKLSSLPAGSLPPDVQPMLGPDATALGQVFWYTLEGRDPEGRPTGGWSLDELRSTQDWTVRLALQAAGGVAEVASIGGFVREVQVDVDPDAMRAHGVTLQEVVAAVRGSNLDVGAGVIEVNRVEYMIRGVGFVKRPEDLENAVIKVADNVPIYVRNVATVTHGPAWRGGALDKGGVEAVGGVVVVRHGENPLAVIANVKRAIARLQSGLPRKTLADGTQTQMAIVPFYDRTGLIYETLGTLNRALLQQILVTTIVVLVMVRHFASSALISATMPLAVLGCFIAMRFAGVDANIVSLSGIAIAIGTIVDMGVIVSENILRNLEDATAEQRADPRARRDLILRATREVGGAVLTAIATTVVGFLPVFAMEGPEGRLFKPLAFTKTFAMLASVAVALTILPALAHVLFRPLADTRRTRLLQGALLLGVGAATAILWTWWAGALVGVAGLLVGGRRHLPAAWRGAIGHAATGVAVCLAAVLLAGDWLPLGPERGTVWNVLFVAALLGGLLGLFQLYQHAYPAILGWCLDHKPAFLAVPTAIVLIGGLIGFGFDRAFGWLPQSVRVLRPVSALAHAFPGLGKEFMPSLDEGSYLYMPSAMPHASIGEVLDVLALQDRALEAIPEVETVVGKLGRAESALDPAPVPMIETVIQYHPAFLADRDGRRLRFRHDADETDWVRNVEGTPLAAPDGKPYRARGRFERDAEGQLIPDPRGAPFPLWRPALDPDLNDGRDAWPGVRKPDDIWDLIVQAADVPGVTSAPRLQPIATRLVMLQSGMRAPMGLKVRGPDLPAIERAGLLLEAALRDVPLVQPETVVADRIVGKPYIEIVPDRQALARYGVSIMDFQEVLEVAIGGRQLTSTVEGRERYPVRVRYARELRDSPEALARVLIPAMGDAQVPLGQVAEIRTVRGPEMIKSEDTFLIGYVLFDKRPGSAEVDVVEQADAHLRESIADGSLALPAGVTFAFAGSYENQVRAARKLALVIPIALFVIFLILYLQFRQAPVAFFVFAGILTAWAGGFLLLWLYNQPWFLDASVAGVNLRELFQVRAINLSVAVWVGFLALFGIASDDGVLLCTYLDQRFGETRPGTVAAIRAATVEAGSRRIRACLMTTATTLLALLPVLTSTGRGADIMVPMAIPSFGGMTIAILTSLLAPVLYCARAERQLAQSTPAE